MVGALQIQFLNSDFSSLSLTELRSEQLEKWLSEPKIELLQQLFLTQYKRPACDPSCS